MSHMKLFTMSTPVILFLLYFTASLCDGFRIKRSGLAGFEDPYALSNAYSEIDRRRRRTDYGPLFLDDDNSYFNPNSEEDVGDEYLVGLPYLGDSDDMPGYFPEYRFKPEISPYGGIHEYPISYGRSDKPVYSPQKRTSHRTHAYKRMGKQSMNELQKIFASAEVPGKRQAPVKRQEPELSKHKETDSSASTQTKDLVQKVREILAAAEKITRAQAEEEADSKPEVIKDEVIEKISPDGSVEGKQEKITVEHENGVTTEEVNEVEETEEEGKENAEEAIETDNEEGRIQTKSKRASSNCENEGYVNDLEDEVVKLRNEVLRLQMLLMLQDKENDYLANALKYATLDQLEGDERMAEREYDDISKATETEELIQQMAEDTEAEAEKDLGEYFEPNNDEEDEDVIKRSESIPDEDGWLDPPVQEGVSYGVKEDENKGSEFPIEVQYPDEDGDQVDEEADDEAMEEVAEVVNEEIEKEAENAEKKEVLQELIEGLDKSEIEGLIEDLQEVNDRRGEIEEENEDSLTGVCLPVLELSQNCAFADTLGIPIDEEARNICSRHQICYTCGSAHGISLTGCNDGYKGTVIDSCKDDNNCIRQSAIFLRLMEKYHQYEDVSPDECSATCVEDFVLNGGLVV